MERTKLCWAGRQEMLCTFTFTCRLSQKVTGRHQDGLCCSFEAQGQVKEFAYFFAFSHTKSHQNFILYKVLDRQVILDFKAKSRLVGQFHLLKKSTCEFLPVP